MKKFDRATIVRITTVPISLDKLLEGQLHFMNAYFKVIAVSSDKKYLEKIGVKESVATFHVAMTRKITPLKDMIGVVKLYFFLKKTKPLIVHTHTPKAGIVGMLAAKLAFVPNRLHTVAGLPLLEARGLKRTLLNFIEKLTYSCATKVYPNSFGLLEIIKKNRYCLPKKLKVLANGSSNGINTEYFSSHLFSNDKKAALRKELGFTETDLLFIFVGRIVTDKGINELVRAFLALHKEQNNCKLLLVGPFEEDLDPLHPEVLRWIESHDAIVLVGYQNEVRPYYAISDCLVFPSYREGFPNVVLQAGAMDLPCIVSDINGCNEIIIENENGMIVPVKNELAVLEAMRKIALDVTLRAKLAAGARNRIVSFYEQKVVWAAILEEYKNMQHEF